VGKQRKRFFFEKKNQKTFATLGRALPEGRQPEDQKVFCCFFSKKQTLLSFAFAFRQQAQQGRAGTHGASGYSSSLSVSNAGV
jgi:hypothetical protein